MLDLSSVPDELADLADVKWVVVAFRFGFRVDDIGLFPCLGRGKKKSQIESPPVGGL